MNKPEPQSDHKSLGDQELSPEAEATLKKARRAFGSGLFIMMMGFLSVLGVMIYKLNSADETVRDNAGLQYGTAQSFKVIDNVRLPPGAHVVSASVAGHVISITFKLNSQTILRLVDAQSGAIQQDIILQ